ncbi:uncharacterized protein LOC5507485 isoform X2 [Nematostella vectensis]|uniref:uncharacterized protein LOC5507485 isoform X2 n=1 Tax=Nematostella vectensis TaxID=45351 RepID=UPI0020777759|nr:uncharacterized protein LOC5507485 isoform X2 [Nematostella vectensis]
MCQRRDLRHVIKWLTLSVVVAATKIAHARSSGDCIKEVNENFKKTPEKYLHGFNIAFLLVRNSFDCTLACMEDDKCQSFNYQLQSSTSEHACELSNATHRASSLLSREGYAYYGPDLDLQPAVCVNCSHGNLCVESCDSERDYECLCNEDRTGQDCLKWKANAAEYDVKFPARSNTSHMISQIVFVCDNREKMTSCNLTVNGASREMKYSQPLKGAWHHICIKWSSTGGIWSFFVDGAKRGQGSTLSPGHNITSPGKLVIGQIQKVMVGGFDASKSFVGVISRFNVWSELISDGAIALLAQTCGRETGNLIDWREMKYQGRADVIIQKPTSCLGVAEKGYDHAMHFVTKSDSRYAIANTSMPDLTALTLCVTLKTSFNVDVVPFSYAWAGESNGIYIIIWDTGISFFIDGYRTDSGHALIRDLWNNKWHTVCLAWQSSCKMWGYIDGVEVTNSSTFVEGSTVRGTGVAVLGQDQDSYGGGFQQSQAFLGLLKNVNLWDRVLTVNEIIQIAQGCGEARGNAISWQDLRFASRNKLPIIRYSDCVTANQSDFMFTIPSGGTDFVQLPTLPSLGRFTVCLWLKERAAEILKYVVNSYVELMLSFSHVGALSLRVGNVVKNDSLTIFPSSIWKHLCLTWNNEGSGTSRVFNNGVLRMTHSPHAGGVTLKADGSLRLLNCTVTRFNMWSEILADEIIHSMSLGPGSETGDLVAWRDVMTKGFGNTKLTLTPEATNDGDEMNYELIFPSQSTNNRVGFTGMPSMTSLTTCAWFKTSALLSDMYILQHAHSTVIDSMRLTIWKDQEIFFGVNNTIEFVDLGVSFRDDKWHMLCWSWRSSDGFYKIYLDGATIHASSGYQKGHSVPSGGVLVIGQDQDSLEGGYDAKQSFVGSLSGVNIWQTVLGDDVIQAMSAGCNMWSGDAVSWLQLRRATITGVTIKPYAECSLPGAIVQGQRDEWCNKEYSSPPQNRLYSTALRSL